jgi:hypothetical protein
MAAGHDLTNKGCWVVDRKISLGLILAIIIHAVAVITWLVRMESRVGQLERTDVRHEQGILEQQRMAVCIEGIRTDISWIRENMKAGK